MRWPVATHRALAPGFSLPFEAAVCAAGVNKDRIEILDDLLLLTDDQVAVGDVEGFIVMDTPILRGGLSREDIVFCDQRIAAAIGCHAFLVVVFAHGFKRGPDHGVVLVDGLEWIQTGGGIGPLVTVIGVIQPRGKITTGPGREVFHAPHKISLVLITDFLPFLSALAVTFFTRHENGVIEAKQRPETVTCVVAINVLVVIGPGHRPYSVGVLGHRPFELGNVIFDQGPALTVALTAEHHVQQLPVACMSDMVAYTPQHLAPVVIDVLVVDAKTAAEFHQLAFSVADKEVVGHLASDFRLAQHVVEADKVGRAPDIEIIVLKFAVSLRYPLAVLQNITGHQQVDIGRLEGVLHLGLGNTENGNISELVFPEFNHLPFQFEEITIRQMLYLLLVCELDRNKR